MTLAEAHAALRAALPAPRDFSIEVTSREYSHMAAPRVDFDVWDGDNHHVASTLEAAVNACVAAHRPRFDPLAEAEALFAEAAPHPSAAPAAEVRRLLAAVIGAGVES